MFLYTNHITQCHLNGSPKHKPPRIQTIPSAHLRTCASCYMYSIKVMIKHLFVVLFFTLNLKRTRLVRRLQELLHHASYPSKNHIYKKNASLPKPCSASGFLRKRLHLNTGAQRATGLYIRIFPSDLLCHTKVYVWICYQKRHHQTKITS